MEEKKKDRKKTGLLLSILGVISLVLITAGVTYAFFSYAREGQTENVITTGTIRFAYNESTQEGNGILIQDALPMEDADGMLLTNTEQSGGKLFNFSVTSVTPTTAKIPYVVTVKKTDTSTLNDRQVKLYLVASGSETGNGATVNNGAVRTFYDLPDLTTNTITNDIANDYEKILFVGEVPANAANHTTNFVLRMWLNGDVNNGTVDYSPYEFMLKSSVSGTSAINATQAITAGNFITSTAYYALPATAQAASCSVDLGALEVTEDNCEAASGEFTPASTHVRGDYERIAYVYNDGTVLTISQAVALGYATADANGNYTFNPSTNVSEQYYPVNNQTFTVKVNVYAQGAKVATN